MQKLRLWNRHSRWEEAESAWDAGSKSAGKAHPLKVLKTLPDMPGMTPDTAKNLKWKAFRYMVGHDRQGRILRRFLKHPVRYGLALMRSLIRKKSFKRDGDFFLYGVEDVAEFERLLGDSKSILVVGFSYCHKPFECPSGRFTDQCIHDPEHSVCRQCFIGKAVNALPDHGVMPLFIPTIHYIGEKIFDVVHANPGKRVLFIITACELTLEMFGDWGNMVDIKGLGVRLDGRICNTMKAFELSEAGIKPGLTVVLDDTQAHIMRLIRRRRELDTGGRHGTMA